MSDMGSDDGLKANALWRGGHIIMKILGCEKPKRVSSLITKQAFETFDSIPVSCQLCDLEQEISPVSQSILP